MHILILLGLLAIGGGAVFDNNNETLNGLYDDACAAIDGNRLENGDCDIDYDAKFGK